MNYQDTQKSRTQMQNRILDLEKKYFSIFEGILTSECFLSDLLTIEKEVRENYPKFQATWNLKNKIKVPAERLIRHHVYTQLHDIITGIYPSPISSDLGIMTDDCVLCIDVKTIDTVGNSVDIFSTQVEPNQISFDNSKRKYITTVSNLEPIDHYSRRPVLTYVIKIIYTDNNYQFSLSRGEKPSLVLACIPNGELSNLFNNDIIKNFKTYSYYSAADDDAYRPIFVAEGSTHSQKAKDDWTYNYCVNTMGLSAVKIRSDRGDKPAYYDAEHKCIWWLTSVNNKPAVGAVKSGSTARLYNEILRDRFDSNNGKWIGYKELPIPPALP